MSLCLHKPNYSRAIIIFYILAFFNVYFNYGVLYLEFVPSLRKQTKDRFLKKVSLCQKLKYDVKNLLLNVILIQCHRKTKVPVVYSLDTVFDWIERF